MNVVIANDKKSILDHYFIRGQVFVIEQEISWALEFDDWDYEATFFVLYDEDAPIGAARLYKNKVGRVAVLKEHRHKKAGSVIMDAVEAYAKTQGIKTLELGAQCYIIPFYEKLGYVAYGDIFLDADIEHRMMKKEI
ncbi:GNAT family N-acetyltransferase [Liberiplasma polymorphum]|uniref:GNAT family N-acetyltransferase n=1 Tax=Liberiplasma polymorphum TaxID=3374570 RepID=UPI003770DA06